MLFFSSSATKFHHTHLYSTYAKVSPELWTHRGPRHPELPGPHASPSLEPLSKFSKEYMIIPYFPNCDTRRLHFNNVQCSKHERYGP